jgi:hypothetical protein
MRNCGFDGFKRHSISNARNNARRVTSLFDLLMSLLDVEKNMGFEVLVTIRAKRSHIQFNPSIGPNRLDSVTDAAFH